MAEPSDMEHDDSSHSGRDANDPAPEVPCQRLFQIIALVKPFRTQAVLAALESVDILGGTVREAMGYGRQKDRLHQYLGSEYNSSFLPKVELTLFVEAKHIQDAIKAIVGQARTGRIGDGKIFVIPCLPEDVSW